MSRPSDALAHTLPTLAEVSAQFDQDLLGVVTEEDLFRVKSAYLGREGAVTSALKNLSKLSPEERPAQGALINSIKQKIESDCRARLEDIAARKKNQKIASESLDVTLPGRAVNAGGFHPVASVLEKVEDIFAGIGFSIFEGPEIETDFYNFEALNIPAHHPARDMQDTFYLEGADAAPQTPALRTGKADDSAPLSHLLRTHTSPVQIHVMKKMKPPIRMIAPGVVYRKDSDVTHTPMFHQVEGLVVDTTVKFSELKGTVTYFLQKLFGDGLKVRFRPSYFPFTEPSAEIDLQCVMCHGKKQETPCRLCKATGWLEVGGCGMVHPHVFEKVGYDPKKITGFAFGMGIERLAMIRYGIPDIRLYFENDLRFLSQFREET